MDVHVFVGPTLPVADVHALVPGALVHAPVAHGDLLALDVAPGDVVVVIDGLYHQRAPVRHKELLHVLARGARVVGCASMGAMRAAELAGCGMVGHGRVFEMYHRGVIDADDEVAVVHLERESYTARNVALVSVRHAAAEAVAGGAITDADADALVVAARTLHYTDRSWAAVRRAAAATGHEGAVAALEGFLAQHPELADVKRLDAVETLRDLRAVLADAPPPPDLGAWRNPHLYTWVPEYRGRRGGDDGDLVSEAEVLRHRQVHEPGFEHLWRRFVVAEVAAAAGTPGADEVAVARGTFEAAGALDEVLDGTNPYVPERERASLPREEVLVRTLVRAYTPPRGASDVLARLEGPADPDDVDAAVRRARETNDRVHWRNGVRLVERLSAHRLTRHLETLWDVGRGDAELLLARARDRGLPSLADAVAAVRPYFLRDEPSAAGGATRDRMAVATEALP